MAKSTVTAPPSAPLNTANKELVQVMHLYAGLELIGSKSSVNAKEALMWVTPMGVKMISKKSRRKILVPWSNIKGAELVGTDTE